MKTNKISSTDRLVTFGCSYTYGAYLPDCITRLKNGSDCQGPEASKLAWPQILGNLMNKTVVNKSTVGASNLEILYHILNFKFHNDDTVVVMWTFPNRDLIFKRWFKTIIKPFKQLKSSFNDKYSKEWMISYNEKDAIIKSWIYMQHAELYLSKKGIKIFNCIASPDSLLKSKPEFVNVDTLLLIKNTQVDYALDGIHPGIESHKKTAQEIYNAVSNIDLDR